MDCFNHIFNDIFYLVDFYKILFQHEINKNINEILYFFFSSHYVFEIWCVVYTDSTSQFALAIFQGLKSVMWLGLSHWRAPVYTL